MMSRTGSGGTPATGPAASSGSSSASPTPSCSPASSSSTRPATARTSRSCGGSDADQLRVLLVWRWRGDTGLHLLLDGDVMHAALAGNPVLGRATALEARLYRG